MREWATIASIIDATYPLEPRNPVQDLVIPPGHWKGLEGILWDQHRLDNQMEAISWMLSIDLFSEREQHVYGYHLGWVLTHNTSWLRLP